LPDPCPAKSKKGISVPSRLLAFTAAASETKGKGKGKCEGKSDFHQNASFPGKTKRTQEDSQGSNIICPYPRQTKTGFLVLLIRHKDRQPSHRVTKNSRISISGMAFEKSGRRNLAASPRATHQISLKSSGSEYKSPRIQYNTL